MVRVRIEIEVENGEEFAEIILNGILHREIFGARMEELKEIPEILETPKKHKKSAETYDRTTEEIIAEKVLGHKRGRTPRAQIRLIQYLYSKGGIAPYKEAIRRFGETLWRALKKGYVYAGADNGEKYVALSDEIRRKLDEISEATE